MMFPKHKLRDASFIKKFRKEHKCCEICGKEHCLEVAHIISKGAGGPDMEENVVMLDGPAAFQAGCHGLNHIGSISKQKLFEIVAHRLGITPEECEKRVRRRMGYNV
jgi:hypothetical protein